MTPKDIIDALLDKKLVSVKEKTESILNQRLANKLQEKYEDIAPSVFEAKKKLDPVDHSELKGKHKDREDKDVDNDGDVDDSDKFLHKKRKAISKAIKKEAHDCDEVHPDVSHKEWEKTQNEAHPKDVAAYKKRKKQEEGAELEIAKEKEKQIKSRDKVKNLERRVKDERQKEKV